MEKDYRRKAMTTVVGMFPHLSTINQGLGTVMRASSRYPLNIYGFDTGNPFESHQDFFTDQDFLNDNTDLINRSLARSLKMPKSIQNDIVQSEVIQTWLSSIRPDIEWDKILGYLSAIDQKTYENSKTQYNFIVSGSEAGYTLDPSRAFKITDQMGSSLFTYFKVTKDFKLISMEEVSWSEISVPSGPLFYPSFLHPLMSALKTHEILVSRTQKGDIIICNANGIIATKRRGSWKIFYKEAILSRVFTIMSGYSSIIDKDFSSRIVSALLDLSFKRHGALIIFDSKFKTKSSITNQQSILGEQKCKGIRRCIGSTAQSNEYGVSSIFMKQRIFCELASIDGAVIIDESNILAYNSLIYAECSGSDVGARSTAASAAFGCGALPFKVSSDGDTEIIFKNPNNTEKCIMCLA